MHPKRIENPKAKRPKAKDKQLNEFVQIAWSKGWWAYKTAEGHIMCFHPTDMKEKICVNNTAGDPHTVRNVRKLFRNAGLKL